MMKLLALAPSGYLHQLRFNKYSYLRNKRKIQLAIYIFIFVGFFLIFFYFIFSRLKLSAYIQRKIQIKKKTVTPILCKTSLISEKLLPSFPKNNKL